MTQHSNFPLRPARDRATPGNDTTLHSASHQAAWLNTATASRGYQHFPTAAGVSTAVTLTAAFL